MHMKHLRAFGLIIGLLVLMTGSWTTSAQDDSNIPQVTINATADGFNLSDSIPEGAATITVQNDTGDAVEADFFRLNPGVTVEDFEQAVSGDPLNMLGLGTYLPGIPVPPGATAEVTYHFLPGEYLLLNWPAEAPEEIIPFTVADVEGEGAAPPEADVELDMVNFAYNIPIRIAAGPQIWHIHNQGDQPHEMIIAGGPGTDLTAGELNQALLQLLAGEEVEEGPEPSIFVPPMSPGAELWITLDLEPGSYIVLCTFPNLNGNFEPHVALGMRQTFIVTE